MEYLILSLVLLAFLAAFFASRMLHHGNPFPFTKKNQLFTQVERSYLSLLEKAVGDHYKIINRVKLADLIELRQNTDIKTKRSAMIKLNAKTIDYVLVDNSDMSIVAAIDLVNNTNTDGHKAIPDWFVSGSLEASGIPYIRMKVKASYTVAEVQQGLAAKIGQLNMPVAPVVKGTFKRGPTRPVRPLRTSEVATAQPAPVAALQAPSSMPSFKLNTPALVRVS